MEEDLPEILNNHQLLLGLHEERPRPTKHWDMPSEEEINTLVSRIQRKYPDELRIERICRGSLGLYLFLKFCRSGGDTLLPNFVGDVCEYRKAIGKTRVEMATLIWSEYLERGSTSTRFKPQVIEASNSASRKSSFDIPNTSVSFEGVLTLEPSGGSSNTNALGVYGPSVEEVATTINTLISTVGIELNPPPTPRKASEAELRVSEDVLHSGTASNDSLTRANLPGSFRITFNNSTGSGLPGIEEHNTYDVGESHASTAYNQIEDGEEAVLGPDGILPEGVEWSAHNRESVAAGSTRPSYGLRPSLDLPPTDAGRVRSLSGSIISPPKTNRPSNLTPLTVPPRNRGFELYAEDSSTPASPTDSVHSPEPDSRLTLSYIKSPGERNTLQCLENVQGSLPVELFDAIEAEIFRRLLSRFEDSFRSSECCRQYFRFLCIQTKPLIMDDFKQYRKLGRGGFGDVYAVKRCTTGKLYAMKIMVKKRVKQKQSEDLCLHERKIMAQIDTPFICCLKYAFSTDSELVLVLDLMAGGDLGFHLNKRKRFDPPTARYYAGRTLLAIAYLHSKKIAYRDLKPDNILLDMKGRSYVSDLGLATRVKAPLRGVAGTRGYWAPDMLRRQSDGRRQKYDERVDWFSLGCFIYELLVGVCPFRTERAALWPLDEEDEKEIQIQLAKELGTDSGIGSITSRMSLMSPKVTKKEKEKRMKKSIDKAILEMEPEYPREFLDDDAKSLIRGLLIKDPNRRLGANGAEEIMKQRWFHGTEWDELANDRFPPPMVPAQDEIHANALSQIGEFTDAELKDVHITPEDNQLYRQWEYSNSRAFQEEVVQYLRAVDLAGALPLEPTGPACCILL